MILNRTSDEVIDVEIIEANSFFKRLKGLMGKRDFNDAILFSNLRDSSIHSHFMLFEIDAYFLDEKKIIFEKTTLKPWKFHKPKKQAKYILETKKNKLKLKIGDKLEFF